MMCMHDRNEYHLLVIRRPSMVSGLNNILRFCAADIPSMDLTLFSHSSKYGRNSVPSHLKCVEVSNTSEYIIVVVLCALIYTLMRKSSAERYGFLKGFLSYFPAV